MQIDPEVERHVREAFGAVMAKDGARLVAAFQGLDRDQSLEAATYGIFVVGFIVNDVFRDGWTAEQLRNLAAKIVDSEKDWINLGDVGDVANLLDAAGKSNLDFPDVPREDVLGNLFVCGGYLLTSFRLDGQDWWQYLDEVWEAALAAPESP